MIKESKCENCGGWYHRHQGDQRFCSRDCGNQWHIEERRRAMAAHRQQQAEQQRGEGRA
jgi:hypothetical protein